MSGLLSRRRFLRVLASAAATIGGLGNRVVFRPGRGTRKATAAVRWTVRVPLTGQIGVLSYHCGGASPCDGALDFFYRTAPNDKKVKLYILSDTGKSGYGGILSIVNSCSTNANRSHRRMFYNLATDAFVLLGVGVCSHIVPASNVGDLVSGNGGKLGDITPGDNQVFNCYDPTHAHFGVQRPNMSEVGGPWPNRNVTAGVEAPWEKYV